MGAPSTSVLAGPIFHKKELLQIIFNNYIGIKMNILIYIKTFSWTQNFGVFLQILKEIKFFFMGFWKFCGPVSQSCMRRLQSMAWDPEKVTEEM